MKFENNLFAFMLLFVCISINASAQNEKTPPLNSEDWTILNVIDILDSLTVDSTTIFVNETWEEITATEYIEQYRFVKHEKTIFQHKENNTYAVKLSPLTNPLKMQMFQKSSERFQKVFDLNKQPAPAFELTTLEGKVFKATELKGKIIVLSFWFINCPPCIREMPELNEVFAKYKDNPDIIFLSYALDSKEKLKDFLTERTFEFHIGDKENDMTAFQVAGYPTNFVIDQNGTIDLIIGGSQVKGVIKIVLEEKIDELLAK